VNEKLAKDLKLDERHHVEKPLLDQLASLSWEVNDCDSKQHPGDTFRDSFTEVVMLPVLRKQLKVINNWLEDDQVEEAVKQLTANFPGTSLIQNNRHAFNLLLENISVSENRKTGEKSPTVRFIDFKHRENNSFIAVCQFKVRILGTEHHIVPDVVLFLNGLPVVVIECKSPKTKEPIPEAINQLLRYSEQRDAKGEGSPALFYYNQFVITTCRQEAKFGTITTHSEKHFYRWSDPYPRSVNDLEHGNSSPNDQQRLVAGMLDRDNLLDIIRTFTLFSTNDKGEMIKIVGRYQQFRAVKLAVKRLLEGKSPRERSGIIWHTQGSGKSLTMMFMVREMYPDSLAMDTAFQDVFSEYTLQERMEILGYGSRDSYLEADTTIEAKAKDMVAHYLTHVFPNGFKAQIVATSREAAVRYKKHVDTAVADTVAVLEKDNPLKLDVTQLKRLKSDVVISGNHNDELHLKAYSDRSKHEATIKSFKLPFGVEDQDVNGDMGIVIVNNMLLTGFDAPVEQVMYLDKIVVQHGLLQAIARVNRVSGAAKDRGFVVDYVGIGHHLKKAIDSYDEREQSEVLDVLSFPEQELRELQASHTAIVDFLNKHGLTDLTDHDAFFDLFYDEDLRFEFMSLFREFTKCLNVVFPAKEALGFMAAYERLAEVNVLAGKHFRDGRLSMKGIPPKLRKITDAFLVSRGIELKVEPISILDEDFEKDVSNRKRTKTKAAEIEHAIRHHLDVDLNDDPELQASFAEALRIILLEFDNNWNEIFRELEKLRQRIIGAGKEPTFGLNRKKQMPFFRMLRKEVFGEAELDEDGISSLVSLTQHIFGEVERELKLIGFWESIPARNKLKAHIKTTLLQPDYSKLPNVVQNREHIVTRVIELAEKNNDAILYAT
jgi:rRNA processing protein Krr1/Pno1